MAPRELRAKTTSQASAITGLPPATARRCLYTLARLGYVAPRGDAYVLRPTLLPLARAYLSSTDWADAAHPLLERLRDRVGESCSLGALDDGEVVYVARAEMRRITSIALGVGSLVPAYCTSMGRVLLAQLPEAELDAYLAAAPFPARTARTRVTADAVRRTIDEARTRGYTLVDQELEEGLRSIAVPVVGPPGTAAAAIHVGAPVARVTREELTGRVLTELRAGAGELVAAGRR